LIKRLTRQKFEDLKNGRGEEELIKTSIYRLWHDEAVQKLFTKADQHQVPVSMKQQVFCNVDFFTF